MTRILVDLDDTIADWSARYDAGLDAREGTENIPRSHQQSGFDLFPAERTPAEKKIIREVMSAPSFYAELEPIPGALEALREMESAGHEVFIVTSPWVSNPTCASDKLRWVEKHLGTGWSKRTIITADKTVVDGDVLFDDKGEITGVDTPSWTQVLVDQPHNRSVRGKARLTDWSQWEKAFLMALEVIPPTRLIGIGGRLAAGKDEVADALLATGDFVKLGMSDVLHQAMLALDPHVAWLPENPTPGTLKRYSELVEAIGYVKAKENPEVRRLLQRLGTDVGRNLLGENVWVDAMEKRISSLWASGARVVVTGIRFPNEVRLIEDLGGDTVWVSRPGHEAAQAVKGHASENSVDEADFAHVIVNDGTLDDLRRKALNLVG